MPRKLIKVCPNCGDPDIEYASMVRQSGAIAGLGLPEEYFCKACGYQGSVILEVDPAKLKRVRFPHARRWQPIKIVEPMCLDRRAFEVLKPLFAVTVMLFFFAAVFLLIPQGFYQKQTVKEKLFTFQGSEITFAIEGQDIVLPSESTIQGLKIPSGLAIVETAPEPGGGTAVYLTVLNASMTQSLERSTGLSAAMGYVFPLFMLFLILGLVVMLFWTKWKRLLHFWEK